MLGDANGMMQRQHRDRRCEPDARGIGGHIGKHEVRAGQHAQRIEVMLADPGRVHAKFLGIECLGGDVRNELVRGTDIVFVVIVAQREIAEVHGPSSLVGDRRTIDSATVVSAIIQDSRMVVKAFMQPGDKPCVARLFGACETTN